jgi:hypothetical protein
MNPFTAALSLGRSRLDGRFVATLIGVTAPLVALAALVARRASPYGAADDTLVGVVFGVAIPLATYAILSRATDRSRFGSSVDALARHGANRRVVALGLLCVSALVGVLVAVLISLIGLWVARGADDPSLWADCLTSARIAVAAGFAYTAWFSLGATVGRKGGGRFVVLAFDWLFGSSTGFLGVPTPRAHLANLLGGEPVLGWSQPAAFAMLGGLSVVCVGVALWRTAP